MKVSEDHPTFPPVSIAVGGEEPPLPEGVGALRLLQMVYRGEVKVSPQQMRAAIEALPFESAKLTAVAHIVDEGAFAERLERAVTRTELKLIEAKVISSDEGERR